MSAKDPARVAAETVVRTLREAGYEALFAGGCVRDLQLGVAPKDYDVATSAPPERVLECFPGAHAVGIHFGVVVVVESGHEVEVATFRSDDAYVDGRRPVSVTYGSAREDASRRDFTINAMFLDPSTDRVIDYVGGREDLAACRLRTVGDATARFAEDKLRVLRAIRFAAHYGFDVDSAIVDAARAVASELHVVSAERVTDELTRMWTGAASARAAALLRAWNLLPNVFPGVVDDGGLEERLGRLPPRPSDALGWATAAWATPPAALDRFRLPTAIREAVADLRTLAARFPAFAHAPIADRKRMVRDAGFTDALVLAQAAEVISGGAAHTIRTEAAAWTDRDLQPPIFLDGHDITALGIPAGPPIGDALHALETEALEGRLPDREAAEAFVRGLR